MNSPKNTDSNAKQKAWTQTENELSANVRQLTPAATASKNIIPMTPATNASGCSRLEWHVRNAGVRAPPQLQQERRQAHRRQQVRRPTQPRQRSPAAVVRILQSIYESRPPKFRARPHRRSPLRRQPGSARIEHRRRRRSLRIRCRSQDQVQHQCFKRHC